MKTFNEFLNEEETYELYGKELYIMEKWIKDVWNRLEKLDDKYLEKFFTEVTNRCGKDIAEIIDHMYSADKLHYYQKNETKNFIKNFKKYKSIVTKIITALSQFGDSYDLYYCSI